MSAIFAAIEQQGTTLTKEVARLLDAIRAHLTSLQRCATTPQKMATIGRAWRKQSARVEEMILTAERLADQPDWKGRASEAHLAVVPRQIEAMRDLRSLAETASESVLVVGAIQANIFDACGLILTQAVEQLRGHVSTAPAAFFSRTAAALTLLGNVEVMLGRWLSGEGTWSPSATQIADGLSSTSTSFEWPRAVSSPADGGDKNKDKDKDKDKDKADDASAGWVTTVTEDGIIVTRPDEDGEQATEDAAGPASGGCVRRPARRGRGNRRARVGGDPSGHGHGRRTGGAGDEAGRPPLAEAPVEQVAPVEPVPLPQPRWRPPRTRWRRRRRSTRRPSSTTRGPPRPWAHSVGGLNTVEMLR
ncbi:hypothetical protein G7085_10665 [Tessaracoccus sp. HDW20]|uniref:hypothetical protein n=1 Tax=Tessaracoccus coleopterorum TaxID=2714950 RepID=UPI0018D4757D|nr:hypothetical protein [Tessaracoccus coleopterorum]NHB84914.1 hypothetical protein [Tessaracoccus coleopterorum]